MQNGLIEKLQSQHAELSVILGEVREMLGVIPLPDPVVLAVSEKLKNFSKLLAEHLYLENTRLYPQIFENLKNDRAGAASARIVLKEMKAIQDETIAFLNKYIRAEKSSQAFRKFITDFEKIRFILETRMKLEEETLFQYWTE